MSLLFDTIGENLQQLDGIAIQHHDSLQQSIYAYLLLIEKWNSVHNLTAIRKLEDMFFQHIMDSLAVLPYINGPQVIDVGTGAGLPGIPIALARPDWQVTLVESNKKKTTFLQQAKIELKLMNITVTSKRIEDYYPAYPVDTIISRAFSSLGQFIQLSGHLNIAKKQHCKWAAMKSDCTNEELAGVTSPFCVQDIKAITVPGLAVKRQLVVIHQASDLSGGGQQHG